MELAGGRAVRLSDRVAKAVVLAAGKGVRLWPLTENRSKHMIPVAGRPVIEHVVSAIRSSSIRRLVLVTGYEDELIKKHLGDGAKWGVKIEYVRQSDISGTASAVSVAREQVEGRDFLVVYGDVVVSTVAIRRVLDTYKMRGYKPTVGLVPVSRPESYGMAKTSEEWLTEIVEKPQPSASPSNLANTGIYVLSPIIFDYLETTSKSGRGEFEITDAISSLARTGAPVAWASIASSEWQDIGRPWDVLSTNANLLARSKRSVNGTIERGVVIKGRVTIEKEATVKTGSVIEGPAWIGKGATLGPFAHIRASTSIGREAVIGNFCEIKNSVVMDGAHIRHLSYVGDSIIGERCNLGAGTVVANVKFNDKTVRMKIRDKLEDSGLRKLGVIIGDDVKTGINCSIMPGVRIASGATVPPGSVVSEDITSA
ncbi:bifunctional sugar-1-phosphate nucleotidylyltransferase/acetyltransferase [[Eubacterium] cellulosolvens]